MQQVCVFFLFGYPLKYHHAENIKLSAFICTYMYGVENFIHKMDDFISAIIMFKEFKYGL